MREIKEAVRRLIPRGNPHGLGERSVEDHGLGRDSFEELRGRDRLIRDVVERLLVVHCRSGGQARGDKDSDDPAVRDLRHPKSTERCEANRGEDNREEQEGAIVELPPESEDVRSGDDAWTDEPRED